MEESGSLGKSEAMTDMCFDTAKCKVRHLRKKYIGCMGVSQL